MCDAVLSHAQELSKEEKDLLDQIKMNIVSDGQRWSMTPEKKMIHIWRKLKTTEKELHTSAQTVRIYYYNNTSLLHK